MKFSLYFLISLLAMSWISVLPVQARCSVDMPRKDWKKSASNSRIKAYTCQNEKCGGKDYSISFHDDRLSTSSGKSNDLMKEALRKSNLPLKFDGIRGGRVELKEKSTLFIKDTFFDTGRILGFSSKGKSRKIVQQNLADLKKAARCR